MQIKEFKRNLLEEIMMPHKKIIAKSGKKGRALLVSNANSILQGENIRLLPLSATKCSFSGGFTITPKIIRISQ